MTKTEALLDRVRTTRREQGLNVCFTNMSGDPDEWSFDSVERRDRFAAKLASEGREYTIPNKECAE